MTWKPDIFSYVDYREYLREYYLSAKANEPKFSYRSFAESAGLSSPSFLRDVVNGDKNITQSVAQFQKALGLNIAESNFFGLLVDFEHAKTREEKNTCFLKIAATTRFRNARRIDEGLYQYLSHWYYPTIREMVQREDFRYDPKWISDNLEPSVGVRKVKKALSVLLALEFVREEDGTLVSEEPTLTTGHEATSIGVVNFHHQMLEKAGESIERFDSNHRDLGALGLF